MDRTAAFERLRMLVGQDLRRLADQCDVTVWEKREVEQRVGGHTIERYLGLPINSSRSPNLGTWELKVVPLIERSDGRYAVKETMAITMLDPYEVRGKTFEESHLFTKLRKIIAVSRIRADGDESSSICKNVHAFDLAETVLYDKVAQDYETIRRTIHESGVHALTGRLGDYILPRTKGPGHGSTSRAFYARKGDVAYITGPEDSPSVNGGAADIDRP